MVHLLLIRCLVLFNFSLDVNVNEFLLAWIQLRQELSLENFLCVKGRVRHHSKDLHKAEDATFTDICILVVDHIHIVFCLLLQRLEDHLERVLGPHLLVEFWLSSLDCFDSQSDGLKESLETRWLFDSEQGNDTLVQELDIIFEQESLKYVINELIYIA